jgi:hypothetical protein
MSTPDNRCLGRVLFADPIGVSSEPDGCTGTGTRDDFEGNILYIGTSPVSLITTLSFTGLPEPHIPPPHRSRWLRIPGARQTPHLWRRSLGGASPPQASRRQGRPCYGSSQEREGYGHHCWLDDRLEGPCALLQVHQCRVHVSRAHRRPLRQQTGAWRLLGQRRLSIIVERGGRAIAVLTAGGITDATDITPY